LVEVPLAVPSQSRVAPARDRPWGSTTRPCRRVEGDVEGDVGALCPRDGGIIEGPTRTIVAKTRRFRRVLMGFFGFERNKKPGPELTQARGGFHLPYAGMTPTGSMGMISAYDSDTMIGGCSTMEK
jgi:hypothetical protein